jgi:hypothetical protein
VGFVHADGDDNAGGGALIGVATDWLHRGCPRTPAEMADLTWPLLTRHLDPDAPTCAS